MPKKNVPGMEISMNEKFFDLKKDKQDRMINAALKVFALNGYQHASTDDMVAEARISKGLLFHYFVNKLGLYTFLYDYSVRYMLLELSGCAGEETDFFELVRRMEGAKLKVLRNYPYMQEFLDSIRYEDAEEVLCVGKEKWDRLEALREGILAKADLSLFRPEVDIDRLKRMLDYTIRGIMTESFHADMFQPEKINEEINSYLLMLKKIAYLFI